MARSEEAQQARRAQILAAARSVLAERGFEHSTVSEIAARAGVAQGTFYLYFSSKEALPTALAEELIGRLAQASERATARAADFEAATDALVECAYRESKRFRDVLVIANRSIDLADDYREWARLTAPYREFLERFLRHWQRSGAVDATLDPALTACVVADLLEHSARAAVLFRQRGYAAEIRRLLGRALTAA